ncbi:MAG TPA: U32 family peptidase, partial [Treponema sp.]|nr:U32 family peptidase [Treponema sp.]
MMAELLAPAGNPEALDAALKEGADAVYLGLKSFNARIRSSNFAWSQFEAAVETVQKRGKKIFVTVNTVLQESETERMYRFLAYLNKIGPDGLIVQDLGVLNMAHAHFPKLRLHASTQLNIASARAANSLSRVGVSRVVLARELGLEEVQDIKMRTSCELEVFVHGALCVSESGLCLFSSYLGGKSANRGLCAQACRRLYTSETPSGQKKGYFFSPHDLQLIESIPDLVQAGVNSFKIEGRMKSAEYVGTVVAAYRYVLDNWESDKKTTIETAKRMLANDFARQKTRYWYDSSKAENVLNPGQSGGTGIFLGNIARVKQSGDTLMALLGGGSYIPDAGDSVRFHKKDDSVRESHKIREVSSVLKECWIDIPAGFGTGDSVYLIQTKAMSKRYPHVLPRDLSTYRSQPADEKLPSLTLTLPETSNKKNETAFPEGLYVQVAAREDFFLILMHRPLRVIAELNRDISAFLLGVADERGVVAQPPFSKREIIVSLDPYVPQASEEGLSTVIDKLVENGYTQFILNNPAHIGMLRNRGLDLIAGPYLYTFNRWAIGWLNNQGLYSLVTPYENSKENLFATVDSSYRKFVFTTVFAYPPLFRMRFELPKSYTDTVFLDRQKGQFTAISTPDGSFVLPTT